MDQLSIGLDTIDPARSRALSEAARAVREQQHRAAATAPAAVSESELRKALARYCRAWADLQSGARSEIELTNLDTGNPMIFSPGRLRGLEQQIERLQLALGMPVITAPRRNWA